MKTLKKIFTLCSLALVFTLIFTCASYAGPAAPGANAGLMNVATSKALNIFNHVKMIIFVVGGFGLVGIAFQAIFGKVKWTWFAGLAVGLAILAAAGAIVNYATGSSMNAGADPSGVHMSDSFGEGGTGNLEGK